MRSFLVSISSFALVLLLRRINDLLFGRKRIFLHSLRRGLMMKVFVGLVGNWMSVFGILDTHALQHFSSRASKCQSFNEPAWSMYISSVSLKILFKLSTSDYLL